MKKFVLLFLLAGALPSMAQTSFRLGGTGAGYGFVSVVREYNYPSFIECHSDYWTMQSAFTYTDELLQCISVQMNDVYVTDFVVDNDSVFFCGQAIVDNEWRGAIGSFGIQGFFSGGHGYQLQSEYLVLSSSDNTTCVKQFDHIISFALGGTSRRIVCAGRTENNPCIVEVNSYYTFNGGAMAQWGYHGGITGGQDEQIHDMVLGESGEIVVAGVCTDSVARVMMRLFQMDNIFPAEYGTVPYESNNNRYVFDQFSPNPYRGWADRGVSVCFMDSSYVGLAAFWKSVYVPSGGGGGGAVVHGMHGREGLQSFEDEYEDSTFVHVSKINRSLLDVGYGMHTA